MPRLGYALLFAIGFTMILNGAIANGLLQASCPTRCAADHGGLRLRRRRLSQVVGAFTGGVVAHAVGVAWAIFAAALSHAAYGVWAFLAARNSARAASHRTDVDMYSHLPLLHASLGPNEAVEHFPSDAASRSTRRKGRLWVVCRKCERWNLTPLEERWEAIEECERAFRDTRLRVSTDNIGLARLREGLELVRIGEPQRPRWRRGATATSSGGVGGGSISSLAASVRRRRPRWSSPARCWAWSARARSAR